MLFTWSIFAALITAISYKVPSFRRHQTDFEGRTSVRIRLTIRPSVTEGLGPSIKVAASLLSSSTFFSHLQFPNTHTLLLVARYEALSPPPCRFCHRSPRQRLPLQAWSIFGGKTDVLLMSSPISHTSQHAIRQSPELAAQMIRRHYDEQGNPLCECPGDNGDDGSYGESSTWFASSTWTQVSWFLRNA